MNDAAAQVATDETGPIDYLVIEYPDGQPTGEALPYLVDLVDRGLIRILDVAFIVKSSTGVASRATLADLQAAGVDSFDVFEGAASGLLDDGDVAQVGDVLAPGSAGAILVYENSWAGPFAAALRRAGAQLIGVARVAVVAGTATAVSNRVSRRQAGRWADKDAEQAQEQQPADSEESQETVAEEPAESMNDKYDQLSKLGELRDQGILTDEEFAAQKAKILG